MKSYIQLAQIANNYYDLWTDDGIDAFHADADEIAAWLKREDLYTAADAELADLTDDEINKIAAIISEMVNAECGKKKTMTIQYRSNNAYTFIIAFTDDHADVFYMDGTEDFPVVDNEAAALDYLKKIAPDFDSWSGADFQADREPDEPVEDFISRICVDEDHEDEILAEIRIETEGD